MEIRWHGTAAIEIRSRQQTLLFDPFVPLRGSPAPVKLSDFDGFDTVLVTHGHIDHILSLPQIAARNPHMKIYCTGAPYATLHRKGVPDAQLVRIGFDQTLQLGDITVRTYHGKHAVLPRPTPRLLRDILRRGPIGNLPMLLWENAVCREQDETVFYHLQADGQTLSLMGSMNLRSDVAYPTGSDMLILPYNGWTDNLPPAVHCIERLKPRQVLLDHYDDTFPPLTSPVDVQPIMRRFPGMVAALSYAEKEG